MLITVLILQLLMTQVLSQTHQQVVSEFKLPHHRLPVWSQEELRACFQGVCPGQIKNLHIRALAQTLERQFFNAQFEACEKEECYLIEQVFSRDSAILKGEVSFHSVMIQEKTR